MLLNLDVQVAIRAVAGHLRGQRGELARVLRHRVVGVPRATAAAGFLDVEKRELALRPVIAPAADQRAHERELINAGKGRAALALIPQHATNAVADVAADVRLEEMAELAAGGFAGLGGQRRTARRGLVRGLGGGGVLLPFGEVFSEFLLRGLGGISGREFRDEFFARRIGLNHFLGQPVAGRRAADRAEHEADGHFEFLVQADAEGKKERAERTGGLRRGHLPGAAGTDVADLRQRFLREVGEDVVVLGVAADAAVHVRLAGADPDFADEHVLNRERVRALDRERERVTGLERIELHAPFALVVGLRRFGLAGNGDGDFFARRGGAPDRRGDVALKHHVIGDDRRQLDVRARGGSGTERGGEGQRNGEGGECGGWREAHGKWVKLGGWLGFFEPLNDVHEGRRLQGLGEKVAADVRRRRQLTPKAPESASSRRRLPRAIPRSAPPRAARIGAASCRAGRRCGRAGAAARARE